MAKIFLSSPVSMVRYFFFFIFSSVFTFAFIQQPLFSKDQILLWQNKYNERTITSTVDLYMGGKIPLFLQHESSNESRPKADEQEMNNQQKGEDNQYKNSTFISSFQFVPSHALRQGGLMISGVAMATTPFFNPFQLDYQTEKITSPNVVVTSQDQNGLMDNDGYVVYGKHAKFSNFNSYNILNNNQYVANAAVGEGGLPEGALQFSKFMKLKSGWEKLGSNLSSRGESNPIEKDEWANTQLYLRNMFQLGDDMKIMSKGLDKIKKKEAVTLIDQYQKLIVKADKPANEKDIKSFMIVHKDITNLLNNFLELNSDVPDEL